MKNNSKIKDIPTAEIEQDLKDTQEDLEDWNKEKDILMKRPTENKLLIYILEGYIRAGKELVDELNKILTRRKKQK